MNIEFISFVALLGILIGSVEVAKRRFAIKPDISRKIAHVGAALIAYAAAFFLSKLEIVSISLIFAGLLFFTRRTSIFSSIHSVERRTLGEVFLPIGIAICALFFLPAKIAAFQFGVLVMGISDTLAALVGGKIGNHSFRIVNGRKSIEGSFAFFFSSLILALFVSRLDYQSALIALILTGAEFVLVFGLDNLIVPILGAYLIQFLL